MQRRHERTIHFARFTITSRHDGITAAGTINWVMQTSVEPLLIAASIKTGAGVGAIVAKSRKFAVNVLGSDQKSVAEAFFSPAQVVGDRINNVPFRMGNDGLPILAQVPCACECAVTNIHPNGDHELVIGQITTVHEHQAGPPLTMAATGWYYGG